MYLTPKMITQQIFHHPFTCMIAGPSKSGKTTLLHKILEQLVELVDQPPTKITFCYSRWQPAYDSLKNSISNIEFNDGLPDIDNFNSDNVNMIILDDLMQECGKDPSILNIFTVDSHHKNISVFFITQNLFPREKYSRSISLNCNYIIVMDNARDRSQIHHLARQMFPTNPGFLIDCFQDAITSFRYGYLFLDFTQDANYRVQTKILSTDKRIVYEMKKN